MGQNIKCAWAELRPVQQSHQNKRAPPCRVGRGRENALWSLLCRWYQIGSKCSQVYEVLAFYLTCDRGCVLYKMVWSIENLWYMYCSPLNSSISIIVINIGIMLFKNKIFCFHFFKAKNIYKCKAWSAQEAKNTQQHNNTVSHVFTMPSLLFIQKHF